MVMNRHHPLARDELIRALIAYTGTTTDDGNLGGTTLQDRHLIGSNDFISNKTILIGSGDAALEGSGASSFDSLTGVITVVSPFSHRITKGTIFMVLNISSVYEILAMVGPTGINQGLCYYGVVTAVPLANEFTIAALAGLGADKFIDLTGVTPYYAFVFRDIGGAAPQGEYQPVTAYTTLDGTFLTDAFTAPVDVGDEILIIHPFLARIMNSAGLPPHVGTTPGAWQTAEADIVSIGAVLTNYKLHSLVLDINNLVGTVTIRMYLDLVGNVRRVYQQAFTVAADGPGLWIVNGTIGIHEVLRVTAQSDAVADNDKTIGYDYMLESM